jgi:hypothetical protein
MATPAAPRSLKAAGKKLWRSIASKYELRPDELEVLRAACGEADMIVQIEEALVDEPLTVPGSMGQMTVHPLISELRQHRAALATLLRTLKLPDEGASESNQQRGAAQSRWAKPYAA